MKMIKDEYYTEIEKKTILKFIRGIIQSTLESKPLPVLDDDVSMKLSEQGSCFVTLHLEGALRGCIGNIEAFEPLKQNITRNAVNAAFRDPRFHPLSEDELSEVGMEISILTPSTPIASWHDFEIGKHGIILSCLGRSAVFLPQVAVEQNWDRETTLAHLSMKAGLNSDAWQSKDARFKVFQAVVFSEKDFV